MDAKFRWNRGVCAFYSMTHFRSLFLCCLMRSFDFTLARYQLLGVRRFHYHLENKETKHVVGGVGRLKSKCGENVLGSITKTVCESDAVGQRWR